QRFYIIVRQQVRHYNGAGHADAGRPFPFTSVEILTRVTPSLVAPDKPECNLKPVASPVEKDAVYGKIPFRACFWPMIDQTNYFMFQIAATDRAGNRVTFATPLLFVGVEANEHKDASVMAEIIKRNNDHPPNPRRSASVGGASVCY